MKESLTHLSIAGVPRMEVVPEQRVWREVAPKDASASSVKVTGESCSPGQ